MHGGEIERAERFPYDTVFRHGMHVHGIGGGAANSDNHVTPNEL